MYPSNIKFKDYNPNDFELHVYPKLWELLEPILLANPTLIMKEWRNTIDWSADLATKKNVAQVTEVEVHSSDGELLGNVGIQLYGGKKYYLCNNRINEDLTRRSVMVTGDVKKALKIYKKYYFTKTEVEKMRQQVELAERRLDSFHNDKRWKFDRAYKEHAKQILAVTLAHKHLLMPEVATQIEEAVLEYDMIDQFRDSFAKGDGLVVTIKPNDMYAMADKACQEVQLLSREEVPSQILRDVGMLKLVEAGQAVNQVGYKVADTIFIVKKPSTT